MGAAGVAADENQAPQALAVKFPPQVTDQAPQGVAAEADGARMFPGGAADAVIDRRRHQDRPQGRGPPGHFDGVAGVGPQGQVRPVLLHGAHRQDHRRLSSRAASNSGMLRSSQCAMNPPYLSRP